MSQDSGLPVLAIGAVRAGPALWQFLTDAAAPLDEIALKVGAAMAVAWVAAWFYDSLGVSRRQEPLEGIVVDPAAGPSEPNRPTGAP